VLVYPPGVDVSTSTLRYLSACVRTRRRAAGAQRPDALYADRGYDHDKYRKQVREAGIGGERGYREGGRGLPAGTGRLAGEQPGRGDQPRRPGPLVSQRHRMGHDCVAGRPAADRLACCQHCAGCCHAKGHRRPGTHVPAAGADELIPVGHAGCPHLEQHLVPGRRPRLAHLDHLNLGTQPANPRYLHLPPPAWGHAARDLPGNQVEGIGTGRLAGGQSASRMGNCSKVPGAK
jgi:hypothetical protein